MPFEFLDFQIDPLRFRLSRGDAQLPLPRQIFDLIVFLIRHRDRPVSKDEILEAVWHGRSVTVASLSHAIARARKILGDSPDSQSIIKTVHGRGYWWVAETAETGANTCVGDQLPFVGRVSELASLTRALEEAQHRRGSLILLIGEAGIGKSRLIEEFAGRATTKGFDVLLSYCLESEGAPPGWPWIQLIRGILERFPRRPSSLSAAFEHLESVFPEIRSDASQAVERAPLGRPEERFRVVDSLWRVLSAISAPMVLVVDDLHRADSLSMWLLKLLARGISHRPLLIVGGSREITSQGTPLSELAELAAEPRTKTLLVKGLGRSEIAGLISSVGLGDSAELSDALFEKSGGHPFFLDQLISSLRGPEAVAWHEVLGDFSHLPSSLRESILQQLRHLDESSRGLLEVASVAGRSFTPPLVAAVARASLADVLVAVEAAERLALIEEDQASSGAMRFRHILVRDAIYSSLRRSRRCDVHRGMAAALASMSLPGERLESKAHHLRSAFPLVSADDVATACLDAARDASRRMAYHEAVAHCRSALELVEEGNEVQPSRHCEILLTLATAQLRAGHRMEGRTSLRRAAILARKEGLANQLAEAALAIAPGFFAIETGVVDRQLIGALEEALAVIPEGDAPVRARLLGQLATALYWSADGGRVRELVEESRSTAARAPRRSNHAHTLAARYVALWSPDTLTERLQQAGELVEASDEASDDDLRLMARVFRIATFIEAGDLGAAKREGGALEQLVEATRHPHAQWYPPMYAAMWEITRGRFAAAEPLMARFFELGRRFEDANVVQTFLLQGAEINWQLGRAASILSAVEENVARNPSLREWECALAFLLAKAGRPNEARRLLERIVGDGLARVSGRMNAAIAVAALAECCWMLGDTTDASAAIDKAIAGWSERMVVAGYGVLCWGSIMRTKGHLASVRADWDEAEECYAMAVLAEANMEATAWLARTETAFARMLQRRGRVRDLDRARSLTGSGRVRAIQLGMVDLVSEVEALEL